jgi:hypothetical protein
VQRRPHAAQLLVQHIKLRLLLIMLLLPELQQVVHLCFHTGHHIVGLLQGVQ